LNSYESIANFVLLEVGCIVFLSIEAYGQIRSTGELETKIAKQAKYIEELHQRILKLNKKIKQYEIDQDKIGPEEPPHPSLIPGRREVRELAAREFLSGFTLFGSNLTSMLNSLVIWLELYDPIMAIIASAIPLASWLLTQRKGMSQMKQNILSYIAISSVVGQAAYFGVSFEIERSNMKWTLDGLLPFFIGFTLSTITLLILTGNNYKKIIGALRKGFLIK
jgi:hypothetical protein